MKKIEFFKLADIAVLVTIGRILGRWGNFFNREAFGGFTNGPLAMQIPTDYFVKHGRLSEIMDAGLYDQAVFVGSGIYEYFLIFRYTLRFYMKGLEPCTADSHCYHVQTQKI